MNPKKHFKTLVKLVLCRILWYKKGNIYNLDNCAVGGTFIACPFSHKSIKKTVGRIFDKYLLAVEEVSCIYLWLACFIIVCQESAIYIIALPYLK
jgi:hypothetical protein